MQDAASLVTMRILGRNSDRAGRPALSAPRMVWTGRAWARLADATSACTKPPLEWKPGVSGRIGVTMRSVEMSRLREALGAALAGADTPLAAADRLCQACLDLLDVDGASVSLIRAGKSQGTVGSSGELSRTLDEFSSPTAKALVWTPSR